jgi:hypothetical protein
MHSPNIKITGIINSKYIYAHKHALEKCTAVKSAKVNLNKFNMLFNLGIEYHNLMPKFLSDPFASSGTSEELYSCPDDTYATYADQARTTY